MTSIEAHRARARFPRRRLRASLVSQSHSGVTIALVMLVLAFTHTTSVSAGVVVTPARLHVEVDPHGTTRELTVVNRGPGKVTLNTYVGFGTHDLRGGTLYHDDPRSRNEAATWVRVQPSRTSLEPGASAQIEVHFQSVPGRVAAYPVLFVEPAHAEFPQPREVHRPTSASHSRVRIAVPVLATFRAARHLQRVSPHVRSVSMHTVPNADVLRASVDVENRGTVHGPAAVHVSLVDERGESVATFVSESARVLPGAARRFTTEWSLRSLPQALRLVARARDGADNEAVPQLMALTLPDPLALSGRQVEIADLQATLLANQSLLTVSGRLLGASLTQTASALREHVVVYDAGGEELVRSIGTGTWTRSSRGGHAFEHKVRLAPDELGRALGVGVEVREGGVNIGYAARTLEGRTEPTALSRSVR